MAPWIYPAILAVLCGGSAWILKIYESSIVRWRVIHKMAKVFNMSQEEATELFDATYPNGFP